MKKILVIDDDEDILSLVQMMLSMHDFKVNAISRWEEMDDNIRDTPPDLILLDISLRGADGRDICKRLKNNPVTRHIRVILFSANVHYGKNYFDCNADAFLEKPFELSSLINTVRSHLN